MMTIQIILAVLTLCSLLEVKANYCKFATPSLKFGDSPGQWNYKDFTKWPFLPDSVCGSGLKQSPINIITNDTTPANDTVEVYVKSIDMIVQKKPYHMEVDGLYSHVTTTDFRSSNISAYYSAKNIHIHTPSEHLLDGQSYPMELHFVLFLDDYQGCMINTTVITYAIFVEIDDTAAKIDFLDSWAHGKLNETIPGFNLFYPSTVTGYSYEGSFAIPPCMEIIEYIILNETIKITTSQYKLIQLYTSDLRYFLNGGNVRPIQPLNGRKIWKANFQFYEEQVYQAPTFSESSNESSSQQSSSDSSSYNQQPSYVAAQAFTTPVQTTSDTPPRDSAPINTPLIQTPPIQTPPIQTPPIYTPPIYTPPVYTPTVYTSPTPPTNNY